MLTPIRMAAGVAIVALAGSLTLISGPLAGPAERIAPAATSPSPSPEPDGTHVQGRMDFTIMSNPPPNFGETTVGPNGESLYRDSWFKTTWASNDPRFDGHGEYTSNSNAYAPDTAPDLMVGWGTQSLANDEGTWTSRPGNFGIIDGDDSLIPGWFDGGGAYEGMSAFLVQEVHPIQGMDHYYFTFEGWVLPSNQHFEEAVWE